VLFFAFVSVLAAIAQQPPGNAADAHNPSGPPGPMESTSIWKVNPLSGALTVNLPLIEPLPGGRGPHYGRTLMYNSASTVSLQFQGISNNAANYTWEGADYAPPGPSPNGPWTTNGPLINLTSGQVIQSGPVMETVNGTQVQVAYYYGCTQTGPVLYEDASGAMHDLNLANFVQDDGGYEANPNCVAYSNAATGMTIDGSALLTSLNSNTPSAVEPDGTKVSQDGTLEDSNGNINNGHDSEGRTLFTSMTGSCPFSNEPVGTPATCTYTAPDSNGSSVDYKITTEGFVLGSFLMPHPLSSEMSSNAYIAPVNYYWQGFTVNESSAGTSITGVTNVSYPDGTAYTFTYDPVYATIDTITFPTGGSVQFVWGIRAIGEQASGYVAESTLVVTDVYLSSGSGATSHWNYAYPNSTSGGSTETAPDGTKTIHSSTQSFLYSTVFNKGVATPQETLTDIYSASGAHMRSVATNYSGGEPTTVQTTYYDANPVIQQCNRFVYDQWDNVTEKDESDTYPYSSTMCNVPAGKWLRETFTTYPTSSCGFGAEAACPAGTPNNFALAHIVNKPTQVEVTDGSGGPGTQGVISSITQYGYDEFPLTTTVSTGILNHDDANYSTAKVTGRGNLTTESKCTSISSGACASGSWLKTTHIYDLTGQLFSTTDPAGNVTQFSYADSYSKGTPSAPTNSYLTKVTHPKTTLVDNYAYNYYTGRQTSHSDWNSQVTTYSYVDPSSGTADPLHRVRKITAPTTTDGTSGSSGKGTTTYTYTDAPNSFAIQEQHTVDTNGTTTSTTKSFDGLGRVINTSTITPQCSSGIQVQTAYDVMSRVSSVTNPYCSTNDVTYGLTQYAYDALGRKIQTTLPDGAVRIMSFAGTAAQTTDPFNGSTNVQHIQQTDGLGRLKYVCEIGSLGSGTPAACGLEIAGTGYLTTYTTDPLSNMTAVNQHGLSRSFSYDPLSRLTSALNPESGSTADLYTYSITNATACAGDVNVPCTRTDARGVITTYKYDVMSRMYGKSYSVATSNSTGSVSDLSSCYQYDAKFSFANDPYPLGRLTAEWQQPGSCPTTAQTSIPGGALAIRIQSNHDAMGRVGTDQQCLTGTGCTSTATTGMFQYTYNLLGNPVQSNNGIFATTVTATEAAHSNTTPITVPSMTWKTVYDNADHITSSVVQDQPATTVWPAATYSFAPTLLSPTNYDPFGHFTAAKLDIPNGSSAAVVSMARLYDNRGRISYEVDNGTGDSSGATHSLGAIVIGGTEQGPTYPASSYAHATITIGGSEGDIQVDPCQPHASCPQNIPDNGIVTVTVNGTQVQVNYALNSTSSAIASSLAQGINLADSAVKATASASVVTVRSNTPGTAGNGTASLAGSVTSQESQYYPSPSFNISLSGSNLSGGTNVTPNVYDAGIVSATVNGVNATASFASGSTPQTIASALSTALQTAAGTFLTAKTDGDVSVLVSSSTGSSTDWPISTSVTFDSNDFNSASFTAIAGPMADGTAADGSNGLVYYYYVPQGGYAPNGNILVHSDSVMGDWFFNYDAVDRLTSATPDTTAPAAYLGKYACWTYDAFGNRTLEAFSTVACNGTNPTPQIKAIYNPANNQIQSVSGTTSATFVYDYSGNTLFDGVNQYWYDAEGQLCAMQRAAGGAAAQYVYDASGTRIAKGALSAPPPAYTLVSANLATSPTCAPPALATSGFVSNRYLVDLGGDQVTELNGSGTWQHSNVWAGGKLTAAYDTKGIHLELTDPLGTKRVQVNAAGQVDENCTGLPFGNDVGNPLGVPCTAPVNVLATNDDATEHHFTGKERDAESGNDYFEARYYSSAMGRFMSPDWSAKEEPVPYAKLDDPQSLNLYAYVLNNPLVRTDPDGHCCLDEATADEALQMVEESSAGQAIANFVGGAVNAGFAWGSGVAKAVWDANVNSGGPALSANGYPTKLYSSNANAPASASTPAPTAAPAPAASTGQSKTAEEMAADLSKSAGTNSVPYQTPSVSGHIDLAGKGHFDKATGQTIPTPHVQERPKSVGPNGKVNVGKQTTRPATKQDVRTAKKLLGQ